MSPEFMQHFDSLTDPRIDRCKRHGLMDIIFLTISAVLCDSEGWEQIEDFGHARLDWLKHYFPYANGIPTHDTIARVMSSLDPKALQECFISWVQAASEISEGRIVAIDGKTLRRSFRDGDRKSAIHMVSAWANQNKGLILGQQKVDGKSNEITAIPALVKLLDLKGSIVTIDAMGTQREIAKAIVEKGADYVLALKGNQSNLADEVQTLFEHPLPKGFEEQRKSDEVEAGHGRIEQRHYRQIALTPKALPAGEGWEKLRSVIQVTAVRDEGGRQTRETRYFISSCSLDVSVAANAVRQHWAVENSLHWVLDVTYREDESRIRRGNAAEVMSVMRRLTLNLLKLDQTSNASLRRKRKIAAMNDEFRTVLISGA